MANQTVAKSTGTGKSTLAIVGIVLGAVALVLSFIPIINNIAFFIGIAAAILGIIGLVKKMGGKAAVALVLGVLSVVITLALQASWSASLDELSDTLDEASEELNSSLDDMSGDNTEQLLQNDVEVVMGEFTVVTGDYGLNDTSLPITVTNKRSEPTSYSIQIEAVDAAGNRLDDYTVYVNSLGSGQSQDLEAFTYVSSEDLPEMQNATFKILSVSAY